jgi:hypothetical protein
LEKSITGSLAKQVRGGTRDEKEVTSIAHQRAAMAPDSLVALSVSFFFLVLGLLPPNLHYLRAVFF